MKKQTVWAILLMMGLVLTRWPGLLPANFSAIHALVFCSAVYLPKKWGWCLIIPTILISDLCLNLFHYKVAPFHFYMLPNYVCYICILFLGQRFFSPKSSWGKLLGGGLLGALLFYLISNTFSFFVDSTYQKTLAGWLQALTIGVPGWPPTWLFFRYSLMSTGLFTGLFAGAMKALEKIYPEEEPEEAPEEDEDEEKSPEESSSKKAHAKA
ncbi:MAG: hypothetical protein J6W90_06170 [Verrucomicrobia bacterium]|nr:hypothetical protein [Verrucomicrobiota bacterium]MBO7392127.1 hypothetical protein [Verrucomicrobiota bacterium]MBP5760946.1 hypothetical protein [Verrucomicrobiota bacterium]MBR4248672.1 hypothetical protein [Verrucomicrobiota bacterium]